MTKTFEDGFDGETRIDRFVGPCGHNIVDGETDNDFSNDAGWFVEVATTGYPSFWWNNLKWSFDRKECIGSVV